MRPATLAGSVGHGAVLQLNNSALCSGSGPAERAAPLENANEAGAAEQQQQPPAAVCTQKAQNSILSPPLLPKPCLQVAWSRMRCWHSKSSPRCLAGGGEGTGGGFWGLEGPQTQVTTVQDVPVKLEGDWGQAGWWLCAPFCWDKGQLGTSPQGGRLWHRRSASGAASCPPISWCSESPGVAG